MVVTALRPGTSGSPLRHRLRCGTIALSGSDTDVKILTPSGELRLRGKLRQVRSAGRDYVVVSVLRTLVPLREGAYELEPATLIVDEATHWKRDFFGGRRATRVRKLRATDRPRKLEVRPADNGGHGIG